MPMQRAFNLPSRLLILPISAVAVLASGCVPPPPAPEGVDESAKYLVQHFFEEDTVFVQGLQGFVDWFQTDDGQAVLSGEADSQAYTLSPLDPENITHLPLNPNPVVDGVKKTTGERDLAQAPGVVSVSQMDCSWADDEQLLARHDQDTIFDKDWEGYRREYQSNRDAFHKASADSDFRPIKTTLYPYSEDYNAPLSKSFNFDDWSDTLLFTSNLADPAAVAIVGNLPPFPMRLDIRHGVFDLAVDGGTTTQPVRVFSILTFAPDAYWGDQGKNGFVQSYSMEINVETAPGKVLRMLSIWNEPHILGVDPTSKIAITIASQKSAASAERLKYYCESGTAPKEDMSTLGGSGTLAQ